MAGKIIFYLLVILILSGASFFFALAESALFSLGKWRARQLAATAPEKGALVLKLLDAPQDLLATIVLGNVLANTALVAFGSIAIPITTLAVTTGLPLDRLSAGVAGGQAA